MLYRLDAQGDVEAQVRTALVAERAFTGEVAEWWRDRARRLEALDQALTVAACLLATLAAVSVLEDILGPWFTGVTASAAALISFLETAYRPAARARDCTEIGIRWVEQLVEIDDLLVFRLPSLEGDTDKLRTEYKWLLNRRFLLLRLRYAVGQSAAAQQADRVER
jgi:hypothetical protein